MSPTVRRSDGAASRGVVAALLALLAASPVPGCERTAEDQTPRGAQVASSSEQVPGFVVGQVASRRTAEAAQPVEGIDDMTVGRRLRASVLGLPMFEEEGGPGPVIDFSVEFGLGVGQNESPPPGSGAGTGAAGGDEAPYVVLMLAVEGGAAGDPRYQFEEQGLYRERIAPGETAEEAGERVLDAGVADLVAAIGAEAAPRVATDDEVVALLGTTQGEALLPVIREVHRRRLQAAAPQLRALLGSEDLELIIATATALGRVRDPEAVGPLIDLISREHRELTELVLPILGQINSDEARAYLQTLAQAADSPHVRRLAQEVLDSTVGGVAP